MCTEASSVIVQRHGYHVALWSKSSDSHEQIIMEHGLQWLDNLHRMNLARVEIVPPGYDYTLPLDEWVYEIDQDVLPAWYDTYR